MGSFSLQAYVGGETEGERDKKRRPQARSSGSFTVVRSAYTNYLCLQYSLLDIFHKMLKTNMALKKKIMTVIKMKLIVDIRHTQN